MSDNPADYKLDPAVGTRLKLNDDGLLPAVVQAADTGEVLMLAWMDEEALARTLRRGGEDLKDATGRRVLLSEPNPMIFAGTLQEHLRLGTVPNPDEELAQADRYEVKEYARMMATFRSGAQAWIYGDARETRLR